MHLGKILYSPVQTLNSGMNYELDNGLTFGLCIKLMLSFIKNGNDHLEQQPCMICMPAHGGAYITGKKIDLT